MFRFKKWLPVAIGLAVAVALTAAAPVRADFELRYSTDGGSTFTTATSSTGLISVTVDGLLMQATEIGSLGASNSKLDLSVSGALDAGVYNIVIQATVTDVPTTPPPQTLSWDFTSSSTLNGLTETGHGWVSTTNTAFDTTSGIVANTGSLTAPASGSTSFSATPPYSWTEQYTLSGTAGDGGALISTDNGEQITAAAVPEPATLMTAFAAMPFLGLGAWLRRRKQAA